MRFKKGDWVIVTNLNERRDYIFPRIKDGMVGKILEDSEGLSEGMGIGVEFIDFIDGHECRGNGKNGYCWYTQIKYLKKITEKEAVLYAL